MPATHTSITWPPATETHIVTTVWNGSIISIPAYQTANVTLFPGFTLTTTTTTKPPPTTVIGANPPPPFGAPASAESDSEDGSSSRAVLWRNWTLVCLGVVILATVGGLALKRYRSGWTKKQEPGTFAPFDEDDGGGTGGGGGSGGGGGTSSTIPGSAISLVTVSGQNHQTVNSNNNVRERRNSQPIPRALDLERSSRP
ncbi:hypothetical protein BCR41DRAFT_45389 [Lobosporangium transversale]|uniref:Uncharacterized protein n=1 Tax=Lobosporangium transversale TaxID=64571 RepID=A0A1Y2GPY7_9FUNG|nr:hypothetical protein BCR41DRAFT_45389 [Lobosporangium transversale]ORZ18330.1 hypothetical protein BCR41DRAFT_45389 [Lobosporangium transversale]|eukprot:XP_021882125.1 hypothetical protein BCR41DRAFT_45389 [Lobosporangium transversale]